MDAKKVLVKKGDVAIITCPFCRKMKKVSVTKYKEEKKRELSIRCSCGNIFCLCLEYREYPRKSVRLLGKSINLSKSRESLDIIIKNISLGGIGFYALKNNRTRKDDWLQVLFALNDCNNTPVDADTIVRAATGDYVGCEFKATENFRTSLGFYLLG